MSLGPCRAFRCTREATTDVQGGHPLCEPCEDSRRRISWRWGKCAEHGRLKCSACVPRSYAEDLRLAEARETLGRITRRGRKGVEA